MSSHWVRFWYDSASIGIDDELTVNASTFRLIWCNGIYTWQLITHVDQSPIEKWMRNVKMTWSFFVASTHTHTSFVPEADVWHTHTPRWLSATFKWLNFIRNKLLLAIHYQTRSNISFDTYPIVINESFPFDWQIDRTVQSWFGIVVSDIIIYLFFVYRDNTIYIQFKKNLNAYLVK